MAPGGTYELIDDLATWFEGPPPRVRVYHPRDPRFSAHADDPRALLLLHDGQNVFERGAETAPSWSVERALDALVAEGALPPLLAVAIDHRRDRRIADFSPWIDGRGPSAVGGARYAEALVEHLLPTLHARYPLSKDPADTAIVGSSLGGLISLYAAWRYPRAFGRVAALSPSVMWGDEGLARAWSHRPVEPQRIYLDVGSRERFHVGGVRGFTLDYGHAVRDFHAHLRSLGYGEDELRLVLDPLGQHGETAWQRRFPAAVRWLFAAPSAGLSRSPADGR